MHRASFIATATLRGLRQADEHGHDDGSVEHAKAFSYLRRVFLIKHLQRLRSSNQRQLARFRWRVSRPALPHVLHTAYLPGSVDNADCR
jgi:hypothetical protein